MKRKLLFACLVVLAAMMVNDGLWNPVMSDPDGAPAACTGNAMDNSGKTCGQSSCHTGSTVTTKTGWITWNGPSSNEYTPGQSYTITCTATMSGIQRFGFEAAVFTSSGGMCGSVAISNATDTRMRSQSGKSYITHTTTGNSGTNTKSWSFTWTAPATGKGPATVSAAFNCANNDNGRLGDKIYTDELVLTEATNVSAQYADESNPSHMKVFPQPFTDQANISFELEQAGFVTVDVYDVNGQLVGHVYDGMLRSGRQILPMQRQNYDMKSGLYFVQVLAGNIRSVQRLIVY